MEAIINEKCASLAAKAQTRAAVANARKERGQGVTEYAILMGILAIIAVLAVVVFGDKLTELWNAANDQMDKVLGHSFTGQGGSATPSTPGNGGGN